MYCLSLPLLSLHLRYRTLASTLAAENVFGSFSRDITLRRMVLCGQRGREGGERVVRGRGEGEGGEREVRGRGEGDEREERGW